MNASVLPVAALALAALLALAARSAADPITGADAHALIEEAFVVGADPALGWHRVGSDGEAALIEWMRAELVAAGLDDVGVDAFAMSRFTPHEVFLEVDGWSPERVEALYYSGSTGPRGLDAPLVSVGSGSPPEIAQADLVGKIALVETPVLLNFSTPLLDDTLERLVAAGALAAVVAPQAFQNQIMQQNADVRAGLCQFPVLLVGKDDGLEARLQTGAMARLVLDASLQPATTGNVVGTLLASETDGQEDLVVVGTPLSGWFGTATERGPGWAGLVELARHWSARESRPAKSLVFVAYAGHEVGAIGLERMVNALVASGDADRVTAYVHLGASLAARNIQEIAGEVSELPGPEPNRSLFVSENPVLEAVAHEAFIVNAALPIASLPPSVLNPGGQRFPYAAGLPLVSVSGAHVYYHTPGDLPHTTTPELLEPVLLAFGDVVETLMALDGTVVREANALAEELAQPVEPGVCPGHLPEPGGSLPLAAGLALLWALGRPQRCSRYISRTHATTGRALHSSRSARAFGGTARLP